MSNINLTIGITSCNRKYYSLALLKSLELLKKESQYNISTRIIFVDNGSTEAGLREFVENSKYVDTAIFRTQRDPSQDEWKGKNIILDNLDDNCDVLCFLQDDCQLVSPDNFLATVKDFYEQKMKHMVIQSQRIETVTGNLRLQAGLFTNVPAWISPSTRKKYWTCYNVHLNTTGLYDPEIFKILGKYPVGDNLDLTNDGFTTAEDQMDSAAKKEGILGKEMLHPHVPSFTAIWNDPRGLHALVRGDKRYGHYLPPDLGTGLYYRTLSKEELDSLSAKQSPASFIDISYPVGWMYSTTPTGDQLKGSKEVIKRDGPVSFFGIETQPPNTLHTSPDDTSRSDQDENQQGFSYLSEWTDD